MFRGTALGDLFAGQQACSPVCARCSSSMLRNDLIVVLVPDYRNEVAILFLTLEIDYAGLV